MTSIIRSLILSTMADSASAEILRPYLRAVDEASKGQGLPFARLAPQA